MTNPVRSLITGLIVSLTVPLSGGLLALPGAAQTIVPPNLDRDSAPVELPDSVPIQLPDSAPVRPPDSEPGQLPDSAPVQLPDSDLRQSPPSSSEQPVELILQLNERQLYVYRGDRLEKTFPVAVGRTGWETPTGTFEVSYMLENPGWTNPFTGELMPPGPENPLGERWIAFWTDGHNEIGFHGTPNHDSIGHAASHGCVRLHNEHIRELYELATPGTAVTVLP